MMTERLYRKRMSRELPGHYHHRDWETEQGFIRRDAVEHRDYCRAKYQGNIKEWREYFRRYREEHPEHVKSSMEAARRWREKNKEVVSGYYAKQKAKRIQERHESWKMVRAICGLVKGLDRMNTVLSISIDTDTKEVTIETTYIRNTKGNK